MELTGAHMEYDEFKAPWEIPAFSLCVQGGWEVRYHIADYAEKVKMAAV
jgi:hypothetical protein